MHRCMLTIVFIVRDTLVKHNNMDLNYSSNQSGCSEKSTSTSHSHEVDSSGVILIDDSSPGSKESSLQSPEGSGRDLESIGTECSTSGTRSERSKGKLKTKKYDEPGCFQVVNLKVCDNCGTIADNVKSKKCHKCHKFFFKYWAKRCKIPPCPNCHFSMKIGHSKKIPSSCKKCGCSLLQVQALYEEQKEAAKAGSVDFTLSCFGENKAGKEEEEDGAPSKKGTPFVGSITTMFSSASKTSGSDATSNATKSAAPGAESAASPQKVKVLEKEIQCDPCQMDSKYQVSKLPVVEAEKVPQFVESSPVQPLTALHSVPKLIAASSVVSDVSLTPVDQQSLDSVQMPVCSVGVLSSDTCDYSEPLPLPPPPLTSCDKPATPFFSEGFTTSLQAPLTTHYGLSEGNELASKQGSQLPEHTTSLVSHSPKDTETVPAVLGVRASTVQPRQVIAPITTQFMNQPEPAKTKGGGLVHAIPSTASKPSEALHYPVSQVHVSNAKITSEHFPHQHLPSIRSTPYLGKGASLLPQDIPVPPLISISSVSSASTVTPPQPAVPIPKAPASTSSLPVAPAMVVQQQQTSTTPLPGVTAHLLKPQLENVGPYHQKPGTTVVRVLSNQFSASSIHSFLGPSQSAPVQRNKVSAITVFPEVESTGSFTSNASSTVQSVSKLNSKVEPSAAASDNSKTSVVFTSSISTPHTSTGLHAETKSVAPSCASERQQEQVPRNLHFITSNVQSRIAKALNKPEDEPESVAPAEKISSTTSTSTSVSFSSSSTVKSQQHFLLPKASSSHQAPLVFHVATVSDDKRHPKKVKVCVPSPGVWTPPVVQPMAPGQGRGASMEPQANQTAASVPGESNQQGTLQWFSLFTRMHSVFKQRHTQ